MQEKRGDRRREQEGREDRRREPEGRENMRREQENREDRRREQERRDDPPPPGHQHCCSGLAAVHHSGEDGQGGHEGGLGLAWGQYIRLRRRVIIIRFLKDWQEHIGPFMLVS